MINKKGQVQSLAPAILALVFAAIVLVFGLVMTQALTDTRDATTTSSAANESLGNFLANANVSIDAADACGLGTVTSYVLYNTTGDILIEATNYTAGTDGVIQNLTDDGFTQYPLLISYDFTWGGEACTAGNLTTVGLGTFADFWELIVLAIVITVVIGLLLVVFGGRRNR